MDGIYLRHNWYRECKNVSILVEIAVNEDEYREPLDMLRVRKKIKQDEENSSNGSTVVVWMA